jgi:KUP system potassium uptake protein
MDDDDGGIQEEPAPPPPPPPPPPPLRRLLTATRSGGSRWVDGSEVGSSESAPWSLDGDRSLRLSVDSAASAGGASGGGGGGGPLSRASSGAFRRRFGKQPRRVDSLDVEAMSVRGAHGHSSKVNPWRNLGGDHFTVGEYLFAE